MRRRRGAWTTGGGVLLAALATALWVRAGAVPPAVSPHPELRFDGEPASPSFGTVEVRGLPAATLAELRRSGLSPEGWSDRFAVYTGHTPPVAGSDQPPVLGRYAVEPDAVRFTPRFPFLPGQPYVAVWRSASGALAVELPFELPAPAREPTTVVVAVYPSADELPENLLKLYLRFSAPMTRGEAARRVRLETDSGEPVAAPFVAPEHELWDPETTRLTLFFDPGRIKRGLLLHDELGTPLRAGGSYRLTVDPGWPDARGVPLARGFEKRFRVVAADRTMPSPDGWRLVPPRGPTDPVALSFPEPLDHALLERLLTVRREGGPPVSGAVTITDNERRWSFRPAAPWQEGRYRIEVAPELEDLAGNNLRRPFDAAMGAAVGGEREAGFAVLSFEVAVEVPSSMQ